MVFTANTQTTPIFQAKFGWDESETKFYNTIITTAGVIGMAIGSVFGGKTITIGRRKATLITQTIGFFGGLLTQIRTVPTICIGRLMYGLAAGHANIIMSKSINETVPSDLSGQFGIMTNGFISIGIMLSLFMGMVLTEDKAEYANDEGWRVIFAMPSIIALTQIVLFLFIFKQEPLDFCIGNQRLGEAKVMLKKVYKKAPDMDEEKYEKIIDEMLGLKR